jgi:peptidyl-tRNA hydrolase, PTH1 family
MLYCRLITYGLQHFHKVPCVILYMHMKYLYFGLGNPGEKYEKTRHNAGRILLDIVAKKHNAVEKTNASGKVITKEFLLDDKEVIAISPLVFMNDSGGVVKRYREPDHMLVIVYDDIDLPLGEIRLSYNKSGGSHNGVLSVVKQLGTQKFITLRVGVGKGNVQTFVLKDFTHDEQQGFAGLAVEAERIMKLLQEKGLEYTLSAYKNTQITKLTENPIESKKMSSSLETLDTI